MAQDIQPVSLEALLGTARGCRLVTKTNELLDKHRQSRRPDWEVGGTMYTKYEQMFRLQELTRLREKLVHIVISRNMELHNIRTRVRGYRNSQRFCQQLTKRWSQLDSAVKAYNKAILKLRGDERPPSITTQELKEKGVSTELLWYLERSSIKQDWAIFPHVNTGIEARLRKLRAEEELKRTPLEAKRIIEWITSQVSGIRRLRGRTPLSDQRYSTQIHDILSDHVRTIDNILKYCSGDIISYEYMQKLFGILNSLIFSN